MTYINYQHLVDWAMLSNYEFYKKYPNFNSKQFADITNAFKLPCLEKLGAVSDFVQVLQAFINCERKALTESEAVERTLWLNQFPIEQVIECDVNQLDSAFKDQYIGAVDTDAVITLGDYLFKDLPLK